jgi:hypothetical protein
LATTKVYSGLEPTLSWNQLPSFESAPLPSL